MEIGISTSCFYPLETELSLKKLGEADVKCTEIFFNSVSEISSDFVSDLKKIKDYYGMKINSVHPFLSFGESYLLFSNYKRRFNDTMETVRRFFDVSNELDSKIMIIHGERKPVGIEDELYLQRFTQIAEEGKKQGVYVTQENVVNFRSESPSFLLEMKRYMGELFKMTLDLKQARRAGESANVFLDLLYEDIVNIHISDFNKDSDCLTPGTGEFDFKVFFDTLKQKNYNGNCIIELYRKNFDNINDLVLSKKHIEEML